jgi:hypothetical protein
MPRTPAHAREVFTAPHERIPLDWYDGPVQAVFVHDQHGAWYVFALEWRSPRDRDFCLRPLARPSVVEEVAEIVTVDEADWLTRLGTETLLPACEPVGFRLREVDGAVVEVVALTAEELSAAQPVLASDLAF